MKRVHLILIASCCSTVAADSRDDADLLALVRANATKTYIEQASFTLPEAFHRSGLAPSDKKRLIEAWASASAQCHVEALKDHAEREGLSLSQIVSDDGTYSFGNTLPAEWEQHLLTCLAATWESVGARPQI